MAHWRRWTAALLGLLGACTGRCSFEGGPAEPAGGPCEVPPLRAATGEMLLLRGANVSAEAKWRMGRLPPVDREALRRLRDEFGMNAIRLLVFWEAIEPQPGLYDEGYLAAVRALVDEAGSLGLHVVVDMHQDLYGEGFGEAGAPWWSCEAHYYETFVPQKPWFLGYLQREVGACFEQLYAPGPRREAFVAAWAKLAETLRGTRAAWLGLDLFNEPFWGESTVSRLERQVLPDFYGELAEVLSLRLPEAWLLFEPAPTVNVGLPTELPALPSRRAVYAPHLYPAATEMGVGWSPEDTPTLAEALGVLCRDARRLGSPMLVGEFGVRRDVPGAERFLRDVYDALDAAQLGGFVWGWERGGPHSYGLLERDGSPSPQGLQAARPFPARVAGRAIRWAWTPGAARFELVWQEPEAAEGVTVITLPSLRFPGEVEVRLEDGGRFRREGSRLLLPALGGRRLRHVEVRPAGSSPSPASSPAVDGAAPADASPDGGSAGEGGDAAPSGAPS